MHHRLMRAGREALARLAGLLALVSLVVAPVAAQQGSLLRGRVVSQNGAPIADASVQVIGGGRAVSGTDGRFTVAANGAVRLRVVAVGYAPAELSVTAQSGEQLQVVMARGGQVLPELAITGTSKEDNAAIPGATAVIGPEILQERAPVSIMEALRTVPGLHATDEDPYGVNLSVGIRGLTPRRSSRTLLMEDGVPILLGSYGDPSMHYAPARELLSRVEVRKGSSQIANGPQTVGGVINFVTNGPPTEGQTGSLLLGGGGLDYKSGVFSYGWGRNGYGVSVDYVFRDGDGVRFEQAHQVNNAVIKGLIPTGGNSSLLLKGSVFDEASNVSETGLTTEEFQENPFSLPFSASGRFNVRRYLGQATHRVDFGKAQLTTNAFYSDVFRASWRQSGETEERLGEDEYEEDFNCQPGATSYEQCGNQGRPRTYKTFGIEPRLALEWQAGKTTSRLETGVRFMDERVRRRQFLGNTPISRQDDAELTRDNVINTFAVSGFIQNQFRFGKFTATPAVRIERISQDLANRFPGLETEANQAYTEVLPGFGVSYGSADKVSLFAGVHRGFAPPRPADVYTVEQGAPLVLVDPETNWSYEVGVRASPKAGIAFEATAFRMDFGNLVIEAPVGVDEQRFVNGGAATQQGIEFGGNVSLGTLLNSRDDLSFNVAATWLPTARFDEDDERGTDIAGNRIPYAPKAMLNLGTTFAHRSGLTIGSTLEVTGSQFADDENTVELDEEGQVGVLPSYTVVSAFASYQIPKSRVTLRTSVRNLFDNVYITQKNEGIYTGVRRFVRGEIRWAF